MSLYTEEDNTAKITKLPSYIRTLFKVQNMAYFEKIYWLEHFMLHTRHWHNRGVRYILLV